jgi:acetoin utilization protein AcuB
MYVKDWMTTDPITVTTDTPITKIQRMFRENRIRRLPVVDNGNLVGIVTLEDIHLTSPSEATTLSTHELHYLLSKLTAKDIMTTNLVLVGPNDLAEHAALLMLEKGIGALPVVYKGSLIGIITATDVVREYLAFLGGKEELQRITLQDVEVDKGTIREISRIVEEAGGAMVSIISVPQKASDMKMVIIRAKAQDRLEVEEALKERGYAIHR